MMSNEEALNLLSLGKGEVESSILSRSTSFPRKQADNSPCGSIVARHSAERRRNAFVQDVENRWSPFSGRSCESPLNDTLHPATAPYRHPYAMEARNG